MLAGELLAPWYLDWFLARTGYGGQMTPEPEPADAPANLFAPASLDVAAHGRFDTEALTTTSQFWSSRQRIRADRGAGGLARVRPAAADLGEVGASRDGFTGGSSGRATAAA